MKKIIYAFNWGIYDVIKVLFGSFLFCLAINVFIVPNNLYTGGILGASQLIRSIVIDIFKINIEFDFSGILYYVFNVPLFWVAYKYISKQFFLRTLFAVTVQSILLLVIPVDLVIDDLIVNVLCGGF